MAGYPVDDQHESLWLTLIDVDGRELVNGQLCPAPMNKNSAAPLSLRVELMHADGCRRTLDQFPIRCY
jgi:hypothetical protein